MASTGQVDVWMLRLREALRTGAPIDLAPSAGDEQLIESNPMEWPQDRLIPAEALRSVLIDRNLPYDPRGLRLRGAHIVGVLELRHVVIQYPLAIEFAAFEDAVVAEGLRAIVLALNGTRARSIDLNGAKFEGGLALMRATLAYGGGPALSLKGADIGGSLFADRLTTKGAVYAMGLTISGDLGLRMATIMNDQGVALGLDRVKIGGGLFARGLKSTGTVRALAATITSEVGLQGASLASASDSAPALDLDRAQIGGLAAGTLSATGEMRASGSRIAGQVRLQGATVTSTSGTALTFEDARVGGGFFADSLTSVGEVRANGLSIAGRLSLQGANLSNRSGVALTLSRAQIGGDLFASGLTARGEVRAIGATITGDLDLQDAILSNQSGRALNLDSVQAADSLVLIPKSVVGSIDLSAARIRLLVTASRSCLFETPTATRGWKLEDVHGPLRTERETAARWLDRDTVRADFSPHAWHELASVHDRNGQPADARWLRYQAAKRVSHRGPRTLKMVRYPYGLLAGYGYYPLLAGAWLLAALLMSWLLIATNQASFTPINPDKAVSVHVQSNVRMPVITGSSTCDQVAASYPCFNSLLYALETVLPVGITTGQAATWRPTSTAAHAGTAWLPYALGALKGFSWLTTAILLAGITGLLRKT